MKFFISIILLTFLNTLNAFSQVNPTANPTLWLTIENDSEFSEYNGMLTTNDVVLDSVLPLYGTYQFQKVFPYTHNEVLKKLYKVKYSGNQDNFIAALKQCPIIQKIDIRNSSDSAIMTYEPSDYFWRLPTPEDPNGWLWHLKRIGAAQAWDITKGNADIKIALLDNRVDGNHPDLTDQIDPKYDPFDGTSDTILPTFESDFNHGTCVASFIAAKTDGGGDLAGIGFNCRIMCYFRGGTIDEFVERVHQAAMSMHADVITSSNLFCTQNLDPYHALVIKEVLDMGVVIVAPAGNGINGHNCTINDELRPFKPLSPEYDDRVIVVTSTDIDDKHQVIANGIDYTHSHFSEVDVCAPGFGMHGAFNTKFFDRTPNPWPYFGNCSGTSYAAPIVAGLCGLLKSINKDFTPAEIQHIIKSTTDPVADAALFPGIIGTGRINAYKAVKMANECNPVIITGNETWNTDREIICGITIEQGGVLTITSTIKLSKHSKIIIEPGGKLIINGGKLTKLDNFLWPGIEVWGNTSLHQFPIAGGNYNQGFLELNNATIEFSRSAVELWKPNDYQKTGGIIKATGSHFLNNAKAIHACYYTNKYQNGAEGPNVSFVKNCTFEINTNYCNEVTFYKHVDLARVNGFRFIGCDFILEPGVAGTSSWNHGIAAYDAGFNVSASCNSVSTPCSEYDSCTFKGFLQGISAINTGIYPHALYVNRSAFHNNQYGIYMYNEKNAQVTFSTFKLGKNNGINLNNCPIGSVATYGINLDKSSAFTIEENHFSKYKGAPTGTYIGIGAFMCPSQPDIIYKNYFNGLSYGNYAWGVNTQSTGNNEAWGLKYNCNQNINNSVDFCVTGILNSNLSWRPVISRAQGFDNLASGNTFSPTALWHFRNEGKSAISYRYYGTGIEKPDMSKVYSPYVLFFIKSKPVNSCLSHFGGGTIPIDSPIMSSTQRTQQEQVYEQAHTNYTAVETIYNNLKDGGDTDGTLNDISMAWPDNMWELVTDLLTMSPYLSQEVLIEVAGRTDIIPQSALFDILAANPDELRNETLISFLKNSPDPLPDYMIELLTSLAGGETYKTALLDQMDRYYTQKNEAAESVVRSALSDTLVDYNYIRFWLSKINTPSADEEKAATYFAEGNSSLAFAVLDSIPAKFSLSADEISEFSEYRSFLAKQLEWEADGIRIDNLDSIALVTIRNAANSTYERVSSSAKAILGYIANEPFCNCITETPNEWMKSISASNPNNTNPDFTCTVAPNPASDYVTFNYSLPSGTTQAHLTIRNTRGQHVYSTILNGPNGQMRWDTSSLSSGTYFYSISAMNEELNGTIIIK
ncbi:MAG TPA: hypothetical protein DEO70_02985 [Bacteroidales bacterium]|nr:MAG: hypothetical protein A2X11_09475 [Bacteroidetes bacterium GWE2_42_24]OFY25763.1 MAG: hypothetical protein A2X09_09275 [Bacteroidetes bacterium GWF2_43_11]HBZ65775.1 hypothetical protein [Bacteroidales bacterium]